MNQKIGNTCFYVGFGSNTIMLRLFLIIKATAINDLNFLNFVDVSFEMFSKFKFCATVYEF